jgi:hypothetical protein
MIVGKSAQKQLLESAILKGLHFKTLIFLGIKIQDTNWLIQLADLLAQKSMETTEQVPLFAAANSLDNRSLSTPTKAQITVNQVVLVYCPLLASTK